jgi:hypothetical protein
MLIGGSLSAQAAKEAPSYAAEVAAAAAELRRVGIVVDAAKLGIAEPKAKELVDAMIQFHQPILADSWFEFLRVALIAMRLPMERSREQFQQNYFRGAMQSQMAWYSPHQRACLVGPAASRIADRSLLFVHELTHAAQDQRQPGFVGYLKQLGDTTDAFLRGRCLTEGEAEAAVLAVRQLRAGKTLADLPLADYEVTAPEQADNAMQLHYALGRRFVVRNYQQGGWERVQQQFAKPPQTTSQLAQPERTAFDFVPQLARPDWPQGLDPATIERDDVFGELGLRMMLRLGGVPSTAARIAAIGWRGDSIRMWSVDDGNFPFVWRIAFDREVDAQQLRDLLVDKGKGKVVVRGALVEWVVAADERLQDVLKAVAALPVPAKASAEAAAATAAAEALVLATATKTDGGRWAPGGLGCSVPMPEGYEATELNGLQVLLAPKAKDKFALSFRDNLVAMSMASNSSTPEVELAKVRQALSQAPYRLGLAEVRKVADRKVIWLEYQSTQSGRELQHLEVQWLDALSKRCITATALASRFATLAEPMRAALLGIRFGE